MLLSLVYLALRRLLQALALSGRDDLVRDIELLVLRHQLEVLSQQVSRAWFRQQSLGPAPRRGLELGCPLRGPRRLPPAAPE